MQHFKTVTKQPMTWRTSIAFAIVATFLMILVGWLSSVGLLPLHQTIEHTDASLKFIQDWIQLAIAIGLILPTIAFVTGFKHPESRTIFGFYLLLLIIQIITERIVSRVWMSSLVVVISTFYTVFRLWQLWQGLQLIKTTQKTSKYKLLNRLLWLLLFFWSSNLVVLLTLGWSSVL